MSKPKPGKESIIFACVSAHDAPVSTSQLCKELGMNGPALRAHLVNLCLKDLIFVQPRGERNESYWSTEEPEEDVNYVETVTRRFISAADAPPCGRSLPNWVFSLADQMGVRT